MPSLFSRLSFAPTRKKKGKKKKRGEPGADLHVIPRYDVEENYEDRESPTVPVRSLCEHDSERTYQMYRSCVSIKC